MVDFFKQVLAADSREVISSFAISVMVSRYWGKKDHRVHDTSLLTIAKTEKQMNAWMRPDHFPKFRSSYRDHHDLIHNVLLALTMVVVNMKTLLNTGNKVGGGALLHGCHSRKKNGIHSANSYYCLSCVMECTGTAEEPALVGDHQAREAFSGEPYDRLERKEMHLSYRSALHFGCTHGLP
jgi:hypothetical protein